MSTGSVRRVIIALVYSVNVCQMDVAVAWARKVGKKEEALGFPQSVLLP